MSYSKTEFPRTPYPLLATELYRSENTPPLEGSSKPPRDSRTPGTKDSSSYRYESLSPAILIKATSSILEQVDWQKVVADIGGEGTATIYQKAFEDMLNVRIGEMSFYGKGYRGRHGTGRSMSEGSRNSCFIEVGIDDYSSEDHRDRVDNADCDENDEETQQYGFCEGEIDDGDNDGRVKGCPLI